MLFLCRCTKIFLGLIAIANAYSTAHAFDCLIRPENAQARLVRDTGEVLSPKIQLYLKCEQLRAINTVEVSFADSEGKTKTTRVTNDRIESVLQNASPTSNEASKLIQAIGYALLGNERAREGMVRSNDFALASGVLPQGKVVERNRGLQIDLGFVAPSVENVFILNDGKTDVLRMTNDLKSIKLSADLLVAGKKYSWILKTKDESTKGEFEVITQASMENVMSAAGLKVTTNPISLSEVVSQVEALKKVGFGWEGLQLALIALKR
jgi:hypothetical protein